MTLANGYLANPVCPTCGIYQDDCIRMCAKGVHTANNTSICLCCGDSPVDDIGIHCAKCETGSHGAQTIDGNCICCKEPVTDG